MILTQSPGARGARPGGADLIFPMATIERWTLESAPQRRPRWDTVACVIRDWAAAQGIALRDAIVLLPFAQLLVPARAAFASSSGWMPRIETTQTLAASLGPAAPLQPGQISFDVTVDALSAAALLRAQPWGAAWARRDARAFEQAARALTATAHALARAAFAIAPDARPAHWIAARGALQPISGPGATERLLARIALEWAALAPAPATDRLFAMAAPSAWITLQAGGPDPLCASLMAASARPGLVIDTDVDDADPFASIAPIATLEAGAPAYTVCDDFEHEAQCAAAQVLAHVRDGEVPVALIAHDRVLVRRVRALLERARVRLLDETGWRLSTTRAAAQVMALLQAARAEAGTDALLDWLKSGTSWAHADDAAALSALEATCRRAQIARRAALADADLGAAAARLWAAASHVLAGLAEAPRQPLGAWLAALADALAGCGAMAMLQQDDAGRQVLAALRLGRGAVSSGPWAHATSALMMSGDAFRDWVDDTLEQATFLPAAPQDDVAQVVITPLARAMLRPFGAVVFPGADDRRLGATPSADALLGDALAGTLGVPTIAQRRSAELRAFVHLLDAPRITLMRRRVDGSDPLADSPLVERLMLAWAAQGRRLADWHDPRIELPVVPTPIRMGAPAAPGLLPAHLSASACEALRACPYRFFALQMLRLREDDELEREIEKRDYGTWLHAVLFDFHAGREAPAAADAEISRLTQIAEARRAAQGIGDADFLPFAASFRAFAPRYVAWLHERDRAGAQWQHGEHELTATPAELGGIAMRGVIDRIDAVRIDGVRGIEMIDYKTGSASGLKDKLRDRLEDTQLAFYGALMRAHSGLPLKAGYLAVDGSKRLEEIAHPEVADSAAKLVDGLAHDLARLRAGAGLPALGAGASCDYCAARGVCRRDHWADDPAPEPAAA